MAAIVQALSTVGNAVVDTTRAVGGAAVGGAGVVVGAGTGLVCGTFNGRPLSGMAEGMEEGANIGYNIGDGAVVLSATALASLGKGVIVLSSGMTHAGIHIGVGCSRVVESAVRGTFQDADNVDDMARICAFCSSDVYTAGDRKHNNDVILKINGRSYKVICVHADPRTGGPQTAHYKVVNQSTMATSMVVAFKGTDQTTDVIGTWLAIGVGVAHSCISFCEEYESRYNASSLKSGCGALYLTGHSLGGTLATIIACQPSFHPHITGAHVFNAGAGLIHNDCKSTDLGDWFRDSLATRWLCAAFSSDVKIHNHHVYGDAFSLLSLGSDMMDVRTYRPDNVRPHIIQNFMPSLWDDVSKRGKAGHDCHGHDTGSWNQGDFGTQV